jgi:hypothetical protein
MDVTSRESISEGKKVIEEKEGRIHILVNKFVGTSVFLLELFINVSTQCWPIGTNVDFLQR